jgi:hypothetical protein
VIQLDAGIQDRDVDVDSVVVEAVHVQLGVVRRAYPIEVQVEVLGIGDVVGVHRRRREHDQQRCQGCQQGNGEGLGACAARHLRHRSSSLRWLLDRALSNQQPQ